MLKVILIQIIPTETHRFLPKLTKYWKELFPVKFAGEKFEVEMILIV